MHSMSVSWQMLNASDEGIDNALIWPSMRNAQSPA